METTRIPVSSCVVFQAKRAILEIRAANCASPGEIDFCSGHIRPGESPLQAIRRELKEELGIPSNLSRVTRQLGTCAIDLPERADESYFTVTIFKLFLPETFQLRPNPAEVSSIRHIELSSLASIVREKFPHNDALNTLIATATADAMHFYNHH